MILDSFFNTLDARIAATNINSKAKGKSQIVLNNMKFRSFNKCAEVKAHPGGKIYWVIQRIWKPVKTANCINSIPKHFTTCICFMNHVFARILRDKTMDDILTSPMLINNINSSAN